MYVLKDAFIDELYFRTKNTEGRLPPDSVMNELNESRTELYSRVQTLKKVRTDNFASFIPGNEGIVPENYLLQYIEHTRVSLL